MTEPRTTLQTAVVAFLKRWDSSDVYHRLPAVDDLRAALALPPSAPPALDVAAQVLAFLVVRDRQAREGVEQENRWTLPDALWESLDKYQREGWRSLAAEYARLAEPVA